MGAMQGMNLNQIYDRIADVLWDTQKAQWVSAPVLFFFRSEMVGHSGMTLKYCDPSFRLGLLGSCSIVELQICSSSAPTELGFGDQHCLDGTPFHVVPSR